MELPQNNAGLGGRRQVLVADLQYPVHLDHCDNYAAGCGDSPTTQVCPRTPRHHGNALRIADPEQPGNLLGGSGQRDGFRRALKRRRVERVDGNVLGRGQQPLVADDRSELLEHGSRKGHGHMVRVTGGGGQETGTARK